MIKPTNGRIVWFYRNVDASLDPHGQPQAAMISYVTNDQTINLTVSNPDGSTFGVQNVQLVQEGDVVLDPEAPLARWMPYQVGQAAKTQTPSGMTSEQMASVHKALDTITTSTMERIASIESGTQTKFNELGDWLTQQFTKINASLAALTTPPAAPPVPPTGSSADPAGAPSA